MTSSFENIPFPLNNVSYNASIPVSLRDSRLAIVPGNLMNASNLMSSYLEQICSYIYNQDGPEPHSILQIVEKAKNISLFQQLGGKSRVCPWSNYPVTFSRKSNSWSLYDELCVLLVSSGLVYHQITTNTISRDDDSPVDSLSWKKAVNCLQQSSSIIGAFKPYITNAPHLNNILFVDHLNSILLQMTVVMRNIEAEYEKMNSDEENFEDASRSNNIFIRILVFIYNEVIKLQGSRSVIKCEVQYKCYEKFLEVLLCYYSALKNYKENATGVALALTEYGILVASEQSKTKAKLGIRSRKVLSGSKIRESKLWKDEVLLRKDFRKHLSHPLQRTLTKTVKLLRTMYVRFDKINTTLSFDEVPKMAQIESQYLFSSDSLPGGTAVPVSKTKPFEPMCLRGKGSAQERKYY